MTKWSLSPGQLEQSFSRAKQLRAELERRQRAIGRKAQDLAKGLADLMEPGTSVHRRGIGLHAFEVAGAVCLAAAYLEAEGDDFRYQYAVLCGGEAAKRALRTATLDAGDSDEPGSGRRIRLATYDDYDDFIERLPAYIGDVTHSLEGGIHHAEAASEQLQRTRKQLSAHARSQVRKQT